MVFLTIMIIITSMIKLKNQKRQRWTERYVYIVTITVDWTISNTFNDDNEIIIGTLYLTLPFV